MNLRAGSSDPGPPSRGLFALVTYLPDPLGSFLTELRQQMPGEIYPKAHITFLPPRPLPIPMDVAACEVERILGSVRPFELQLGNVQLFPKTHILYLDIQRGLQESIDLHACLNQGSLFAPESFEFIPHLTLGGPLRSDDAPAQIQQATEAWENSGLGRCFEVKEVVLLWQPQNDSDGNWTRILAHPLMKADRLRSGGVGCV